MKTTPVSKVLVRCLGPGEEHQFLTDNRCGHRICPKCKKVIDRAVTGLSPLLYNIVIQTKEVNHD